MITPGLYRHYKGGMYTVLFTAWNGNNDEEREEVVVYVSHSKGTLNARKKSEFVECVEVADGVVLPRFTFAGIAPKE